MKIVLGILAAVVSIVALLVAFGSVKWYVWDIAIGQADEADRSMLFWGLPILFLGIVALGISAGLILAAKRLFAPSS